MFTKHLDIKWFSYLMSHPSPEVIVAGSCTELTCPTRPLVMNARRSSLLWLRSACPLQGVGGYERSTPRLLEVAKQIGESQYEKEKKRKKKCRYKSKISRVGLLKRNLVWCQKRMSLSKNIFFYNIVYYTYGYLHKNTRERCGNLTYKKKKTFPIFLFSPPCNPQWHSTAS